MRSLLVLFLTLLFTHNVSALDLDKVKSELLVDTNQTSLKEGDIFQARIQIWPVDDQNQQITVQKRTYIDDSLYIADIVSNKRSENNADVVQIDLLLVLVKLPKKEKLTIKLNIGEITVDNRVTGAPTEIKQPTLIMYEQKSEGFGLAGWMWSLLIVLCVIVIVGLYKLFVMYSKKKKQEREIEKFKNYWSDKFVSASERLDFEVVYGRKKEWLRLIKLQTPPVVEFFRVMESVQYKKDWDSEDREIVTERFDDIRGIFS